MHRQREGGRRQRPGLLRGTGPELVSAASDNDPTNVGTAAAVGAQTGYHLAWVALLVAPLLAVVLAIAARLGGPRRPAVADPETVWPVRGDRLAGVGGGGQPGHHRRGPAGRRGRYRVAGWGGLALAGGAIGSGRGRPAAGRPV
jgi:hypothetical protein